MENHLIDFESLAWINPAKGLRFKKFVSGSNIIRLLEFSEGFIEEEYCRKGHAGFVLEGSFSIEYDGKVENYKAGDVLFIPAGKSDKHKAMISKNQKVLLLLFETIDSQPDTIEYFI